MAYWSQPGLFNLFAQNSQNNTFVEKILNVFGDFEVQEERKDKGVSITDDLNPNKQSPFSNFAAGHSQYGYGPYRKYVNYEEASKGTKLRIYRQMAEYPEIAYGLETVADEIYNPQDHTGDLLQMEILNKNLIENVNIRENLKKEWEYVVRDPTMMDFNNKGWETIYSFLVCGEAFYEKVINPNNPKEGLKRVKRLLPDTTYVVYNPDGEIDHFQIGSLALNKKIPVPKTQITYARIGEISYNQDTGERIVLGYLEKIKKVWRQLQLLEEAVVIYRIVRAPERRVWKIATGHMPAKQAQQYIDKLKMDFRQKKIYNSTTGEIDGQANIMNMLEDFWFSQPDSGNATDVSTLPGGENLGEIRDLDYFLKKLYLALRIPENRRLDAATAGNFNVGTMGDVSQQEAKFSKMVYRIARKISNAVFDIYKTHLQLKGIWDFYGLKDSDFNICFYKNNFFEELKQTKLDQERLNVWGTVASFTGEVFSKKYAVMKYLKWTEEEWNANKMLLETEKKSEVQDQGSGIGGGF